MDAGSFFCPLVYPKRTPHWRVLNRKERKGRKEMTAAKKYGVYERIWEILQKSLDSMEIHLQF
jgi:hypothetical protein